MVYSTLISVSDLLGHIADPDWCIVDCRFSLAEPEDGENKYQYAHIPGAIYAHLNDDLSGDVIPGKTGRHPLPEKKEFVKTVRKWGIDPTVQVVAYDDAGGALAAARLWWLLRWAGHPAVAVMDGGWRAWITTGHPVQSGWESRSERVYYPTKPQAGTSTSIQEIVSAEQVMDLLYNPDYRILDSRLSERYRGENETIDSRAGHIPGAVSAPYQDNLDVLGYFHKPDELKARFKKLFRSVPAERVIFYCGSGVTATHNLLAVAHAGLGNAALFTGSWSEWITDPMRPVDMGGEVKS